MDAAHGFNLRHDGFGFGVARMLVTIQLTICNGTPSERQADLQRLMAQTVSPLLRRFEPEPGTTTLRNAGKYVGFIQTRWED